MIDDDIPFIPFSSKRREAWRRSDNDDDNDNYDNDNKSGNRGINAKQFHRDIRRKKSSTDETTTSKTNTNNTNTSTFKKTKAYSKSMKETSKLLKQAKVRVDYNSLKNRFNAMKEVTEYKHWPIQEPALQHLDELELELKTKLKLKLSREKGNLTNCYSNQSTSSSPSSSSPSSFQNQHNKRISITCNQRNQNSNRNNDDNPSHDNEKNNLISPSPSPLWSHEPRIFAVETSSSGKRKYVVCHLGRFMHHYWRFCEPSSKHYYELIREGTPCRLYFDIEYNKKANPNITETENETLLNEFIKELSSEINNIFHISNITRNNIVDLDSSTEKKFSRHFIIHLPNGELFADAPTCGSFVKNFVGRLADEVATGVMEGKCPILAKYLFVHNSKACDRKHGMNTSANPDMSMNIDTDIDMNNTHTDDKFHDRISERNQNKTCFIDTGVYTRNRLFRILGSSKYGKPSSAALRIASANQFPFPVGFGNEHFYAPSFICNNNVSANDDRHVSTEEDDDDMVSDHEDDMKKLINWEKHADALAQTLVIPQQHTKQGRIVSPPHILPMTSVDEERFKSAVKSRKNQQQSHNRKEKLTFTNQIGPSMFPSVDKFIHDVLGQRKNISGSIRAWTFEPILSNIDANNNHLSNSILTYHMKDNRWCEYINRSHKSNNIMWNVSIRDKTYWQSCHDPDCRMASFRGKVKDLPPEICSKIDDVLFEKETMVNEDFEHALLQLNCDIRKAPQSMPDSTDDLVEHNEYQDDDFGSALFTAVSLNPHIFP